MPIDIYDAVLATISPDQNEDDMEIVVKEYAEDLKSTLLTDLKHGFLIWGKQPAKNRYLAYVAATLPPDLDAALNPNFVKEREALRQKLDDPEAQTLYSEQLVKARDEWTKASEQATMMGEQPLPMPPELAKAPNFWPLCAQLPSYIWEAISRDYLRLIRSQERHPPQIEAPNG